MEAVSFRCTKTDWARAISQVKAARPKDDVAKLLPAALRAEGDTVRLCFEGAEVGCPAAVAAAGRVALTYPLILSLGRYVASLDQEEFELRAEPGRITLTGDMAIAAEHIAITPLDSHLIKLNIHPTLMDILTLRHKHTWEELEASGYDARVADAEVDMHQRVQEALEALEPLGVTLDQLQSLVQDSIRKAVERST